MRYLKKNGYQYFTDNTYTERILKFSFDFKMFLKAERNFLG